MKSVAVSTIFVGISLAGASQLTEASTTAGVYTAVAGIGTCDTGSFEWGSVASFVAAYPNVNPNDYSPGESFYESIRGVGLCNVRDVAKCQQLCDAVAECNFASVSLVNNCYACFMSKTCPARRPTPTGYNVWEKQATITGDPHFAGFDGSKYDFQGQPSEWFNIISDSDFQLNAFFVESPTDGKTYMSKLGFMMGPNKISISSTKVSITTPTLKIDLIEGTQQLTDANGEAAGFVHVSDESVTLHSKGFQCVIMTVQNMGFTYLNVETSASAEALSSPHGILGQTAQFMVTGEQPNPVELSHQNENAAGFIEGHPADYLVSDGEFGTAFSFNQFGTAAKANGTPQRFAHGKASYLA